MLNLEEIKERNAYLMNTEPGTPIMLITKSGETMSEYVGHYPRLDGFRVNHPIVPEGMPLFEESTNWDFEILPEKTSVPPPVSVRDLNPELPIN